MSSVFRELYYGNVCPTGRVYSQDSPFVQAAKRKQENYDRLMATLSKREKKLFNKYCNAQSDIEEISRYDTFSYALKLGIMLMTEVYENNGE